MKDKNHNLVPDGVEKTVAKASKAAIKEEHEIVRLLKKGQRRAVHRFPLVFTMLGAFGLVTTFYGFEHMIDNIPFLVENPIIMLAVGIVTLVGTGTLYKKLS